MEDMNRPIFLAGHMRPVLGRAYAIYPSAKGDWMKRHGQGINVSNLSPSISLEFKKRVEKSAICFKKNKPVSGEIAYIVMMNTPYYHNLWQILDCPAYCARIRWAHFQFIEKKRARRKMIIGILLRQNFDKYFIRVFVRDFLL